MTGAFVRVIFPLTVLIFLGGCATVKNSNFVSPSAAARAQLAPSGTLRAAINFGNPILAARETATGEARGVSIDLARELAKRLGTPVEFVLYTAAGKVVEGIKFNAWDIAFFAIDPVRATDIDFSAAYLMIEGAYLVPNDSAIRRNEEVDQDGVRVVAGRGSAYDLFLSRDLKKAKLIQSPIPWSPENLTSLPASNNNCKPMPNGYPACAYWMAASWRSIKRWRCRKADRSAPNIWRNLLKK